MTDLLLAENELAENEYGDLLCLFCGEELDERRVMLDTPDGDIEQYYYRCSICRIEYWEI